MGKDPWPGKYKRSENDLLTTKAAKHIDTICIWLDTCKFWGN